MIDREPFFSVIIPTYNREHLISRAIKSVLEQTYASFELIVVDDGSKDNTRQVVESFFDKRIRYFYKENEERSIARNFGVSKATGMYINFLDSDDYFYNHHLQTAHDALKNRNFPEVLHTGFEMLSDSTGQILLKRANFDDSINKKLIVENTLNCSSILLKKLDVFSEATFIHNREAILSEDWCLWLRLASRFKIHYFNEVTNVVVEHDNRSLNKLTASKVETATQLVFKELEGDKVFMEYYKQSYNQFKAKQLCFIALHFAMEKDSNTALRYCITAFKEYGLIVFTRSFLAVFKKIIFLKINEIA